MLLENNIRGGISIVLCDRHNVSDVNEQILYIDANNLYGWAMNQYLPTCNFEKFFPAKYSQEQVVEDSIQIPDDNEYRFSKECDLENPVENKEKTKKLSFVPLSNKSRSRDIYTLYE